MNEMKVVINGIDVIISYTNDGILELSEILRKIAEYNQRV